MTVGSTLRDLLSSARQAPVLVAVLNFPSPDLVEFVGHAGFHAVLVDTEHGALSESDVQSMIRAADAVGIPTLVRVPGERPDEIHRVLEAGATGILAPHIDNRRQAESLVGMCRYPPAGQRGAAFYSRACGFSLNYRPDILARGNEEVVIGVQLESREGVDNAEEILGTPGIDFAIVGTFDLAVDAGISDYRNDPWITQVVRSVADLGAATGKITAMHATDVAGARQWLEMGHRLVFSHIGALVAGPVRQFVEEFRRYRG